jgi:CBS domain-containing protein
MITAKASARGRVEEHLRQEKVGCLCQGEPVTVGPETTLAETLRQLRGDSGGCVVVVKPQGKKLKGGRKPLKPIGIFTERDYLDKIAFAGPAKSPGKPKMPSGAETSKIPEQLPISKFMTLDPKTLSQDESLDTALQLMTRGGYRHLPLVDSEGSLVGVLSAKNIICYLAELFPVEIINLPPRHDQKIGSREGC